jgi:hypothetical protein
MKNLTREVLFMNYSELFCNYITNQITLPSSRSQATMIIHVHPSTFQPKLVLFGGVSTDRLNDLWTCDLYNNYTWSRVSPANTPSPRSGHTAVPYKNEMFIYGGVIEDGGRKFSLKEDILIYDILGASYMEGKCFNKQDLKWRRNHIAESIGGHMFMHGGIDEEENILGDCWLLDYVHLRWIRIEPKGGKMPSLSNHASCLVLNPERTMYQGFSIFKFPEIPQSKDNKKLKYEGIYLFGGIDEERNYKNELTIVKIGKKPLEKITPKITGNGPCPRAHARMNFYPDLNILIIHGGRNDKMKKSFFGDFYLLDCENYHWTRLSTFDGVTKDSNFLRADHCSVIYKNKLLIFGGNNADFYVGSEIFEISLDFFDSKNKKFTPRNNLLLNEIEKTKKENMGNLHLNNIFKKDVDFMLEKHLNGESPSFLQPFMDKSKSIAEKLKALKIKSMRDDELSFGNVDFEHINFSKK